MSTPSPEAIPERELRLALVCYGGVSLAVYMHGITREILKLIRASHVYHSLPAAEAASAEYSDLDGHRGEADTEAVYFRMLQKVGGTIRLRVLVDVIAGASAGGINGIMLARALAFDLSLDDHRELWLNLADVEELLDPDARAGRLSKIYMRPLFWLAKLRLRRAARRQGAVMEPPEMLRNLSLFMRSRWFEPPFSGKRMSEMMLDALESMGDTAGAESGSLLPASLPLELFVTATDFWGHPLTIPLHDPPKINEREHRHLFHFHHHVTADGKVASTLGRDHLPSLAFAARATSSYPGAFPPTRLGEMDALLKQRKTLWRGREAFIRSQFPIPHRKGKRAEDAAFIDGSVLMNKPVSVALEAVRRHTAHRQIDRRLVYLEPNPEINSDAASDMPSFFKTIVGALSSIPRHQPIRDDLDDIGRYNQEVHLHREVANGVRELVLSDMSELLSSELSSLPSAEAIGRKREASNTRAASEAGYAYEGYTRLKVLGLLDELAGLFQEGCVGLEHDEAARQMQAWAYRVGIRPLGSTNIGALDPESAPWVGFLRDYDIRYRLRRVMMLIRRCNELYTDEATRTIPGVSCQLDRLKARLYSSSGRLREHLNWSSLEFKDAFYDEDQCDLIDYFLERVQNHFDLNAFDESLDRELAEWCRELEDLTLVREVLSAYLGFAYYDVLIFPMTQRRDMDALDEIKVDRIAVDDANSLREGGAREILKGVQLESFGAFFSRRFRENDYLWGRLTAAERLVDIVGSSVPEAVAEGLDLVAFKKDLFLSILEAETPHLKEIDAEMAELKRKANSL
ncbi:patatin-like protein [Parahaliea sp. F7430]|uniref:Patatin-like protein n=1 Tax=Sediminihaliea albiluteola TaxID=2758564 RepID=A0A7W2YIP2_9GAMM|nr:patatin-like protein [Sediminihaliea albiluteola]MBA6411724.1 patatin-like protein [Sediminihaliea albiluteola]